jgi:hypothetical protein
MRRASVCGVAGIRCRATKDVIGVGERRRGQYAERESGTEDSEV